MIVVGSYENYTNLVETGNGVALYSWRLPVLNRNVSLEKPIYSDPKSWNSSEYAALRKYRPSSFCWDHNDDNLTTNVYLVVGKGSAFDWTVKQFPVEEIVHDTIVLVGIRNSKVHWIQPGHFDITMDRSTLSAGLTGLCGNSLC